MIRSDMDKAETDAKHVLNQLGSLSSYLTGMDASVERDACFHLPLDIMREAMAFDVSVLYEVSNVVDNWLILEVTRVFDPIGYRSDLREGQKLRLDLDHPEGIYINEILAFTSRQISHINVPNQGCDMMGFVYVPESLGGGYLFGGDYCGQESGVRDYEASVCEIMCNFLSTILIKTQLEQLAVYDGLTGLHNSRSIKEEVSRLCNRFTRKTEAVASIVLCDIDHFKAVNDTYGHIQGDLVLKEVGEILSASMRKDFDVAGRYGGEEFLLVLDETQRSDAFAIVERLRKKIEAHAFGKTDKAGKPIPGEFLRITLSFGIAENRADSEPCDALAWIARADTALYHSKRGGRNRVSLWNDFMDEGS
ncbi:GGDEF domain-containing protein [Desulfoluna sp.]|uniref:GGDEF domain-containing protein n=1 Tax=Desulfoluna sp. TaxID=2045199 RepID=UPI00260F389A|nr:GGDEF domain-containing protein [Desulfoluna sp.]